MNKFLWASDDTLKASSYILVQKQFEDTFLDKLLIFILRVLS